MFKTNRRLALAFGGATIFAGATRAFTPEEEQHWKVLPTVAAKGKQDDIFFIDENRGWYGNGAGHVYQTGDGGETWTLIWEKAGTYVRAIGFVDADIGLLGNIGLDYFPGVTDPCPLYRTADGGRNWTPVTAVSGPVPEGICAIDVLRRPYVNAGRIDDRVTVRAGGRVGGPARLMTSHDLGLTWLSEDLSSLTGAILDVHFVSERVGFIAGATDADVKNARTVILRTMDGGRSWKRVHEGKRQFEIIWKLSFPTPRVGFATVQNYDPDPSVAQRFVARTTDGGASWDELPLVSDHGIQEFGIGFVDADHGWVGGAPHGFETRNGGRSWVPADVGRATNKIRVVRTKSGSRVFAIGTDVRRLDVEA